MINLISNRSPFRRRTWFAKVSTCLVARIFRKSRFRFHVLLLVLSARKSNYLSTVLKFQSLRSSGESNLERRDSWRLLENSAVGNSVRICLVSSSVQIERKVSNCSNRESENSNSQHVWTVCCRCIHSTCDVRNPTSFWLFVQQIVNVIDDRYLRTSVRRIYASYTSRARVRTCKIKRWSFRLFTSTTIESFSNLRPTFRASSIVCRAE